MLVRPIILVCLRSLIALPSFPNECSGKFALSERSLVAMPLERKQPSARLGLPPLVSQPRSIALSSTVEVTPYCEHHRFAACATRLGGTILLLSDDCSLRSWVTILDHMHAIGLESRLSLRMAQSIMVTSST